MTSARPTAPIWVQPISRMIEDAGRQGPFFVAFHAYRPELFRELATHLGLDFIDFRAERMQPLGWEAGRMPLAALTEEIARRATVRGIVLHNAEALLATKTKGERRQWLRAFFGSTWPTAVVLPIAIFQADLPTSPDRFHRVDPDDIPAETLLTRLATQ